MKKKNKIKIGWFINANLCLCWICSWWCLLVVIERRKSVVNKKEQEQQQKVFIFYPFGSGGVLFVYIFLYYLFCGCCCCFFFLDRARFTNNVGVWWGGTNKLDENLEWKISIFIIRMIEKTSHRNCRYSLTEIF